MSELENTTQSNMIDLEGAFAVAHEQLPVKANAVVPGLDEDGNPVDVTIPNPATMENAVLIKDVLDLVEHISLIEMKVQAYARQNNVTPEDVEAYRNELSIEWKSAYPFTRLISVLMSWIGREGYTAINRKFKMNYTDHGVLMEKIGQYYQTDVAKVDSGKY